MSLRKKTSYSKNPRCLPEFFRAQHYSGKGQALTFRAIQKRWQTYLPFVQ